jgi:hypothetical protein
MASEYTFIVRINREPYETAVMTFASTDDAIEGARSVLQAKIDYRPLKAPQVSKARIGVGQGSTLKTVFVQGLGEWIWSENDQDWVWRASH